MAINLLGMLPAGASSMMDAPTMSTNALGSAMSQQRQQSQQPAQPQRKRPGLLEVVGRVGDIMALMGDRQPLYSAFQQQERAAEEEATQRNALAQFLQNDPNLSEYGGLFQAGMGLPEIAQIAQLRQGPKQAQGPASIQEIEYLNDSNIPIERRQALAAIINNRGLSGAMVGTPDTGWTTNPNFRPIEVPGQAIPPVGAPAPQVPMQAPAQGGGSAITMRDLQTMAQSFPNADAMMGWMRNNNVVVRVSTPQEAMNLPSGTRIVTPDGREKVVP